jgi:hypothetical protein
MAMTSGVPAYRASRAAQEIGSGVFASVSKAISGNATSGEDPLPWIVSLMLPKTTPDQVSMWSVSL